MKINVEFDLTPQEFRQAMGLPDVEAFQQELMERFRRQMEAGVEGYDPMSLLKPLMTPGAGTPFAKFMPPGMADSMGAMGGTAGMGPQGSAGSQGGSSSEMGESMAQGMATFNQYQKMMLDTLHQFGQQSAEADSDGQQKATKTADAKRDAAADKPDSGASASARSRSKKS
ncbi:DUF6489 family protein [Cobetia sp. QF-1]|uniref:DUF6489 family protein n=1 Tax=Cobetia sp. QF-1 TaxID=1969833 RepID=UPI000B5418E3|nr:DUF6489 family protein [Cobetia sp. QF-1]